jgi:hypothetical protein
VAGAGGRQGLEPEACQQARAADVPRIGQDEAAFPVEGAEGGTAVGNGGGHDVGFGEGLDGAFRSRLNISPDCAGESDAP